MVGLPPSLPTHPPLQHSNKDFQVELEDLLSNSVHEYLVQAFPGDVDIWKSSQVSKAGHNGDSGYQDL